MGYIKEPKGIDLVVVPQTKPNKDADKIVSDYIKKHKKRNRKAIEKAKKQLAEIVKIQ
jgi:hypothetical protein